MFGGQAAAGGLFGQSTPAAPNTGLFGQPAAPVLGQPVLGQQATPLFGSKVTAAPTPFGQSIPAAPTLTPAFGQSLGFGQPMPRTLSRF